MIINEANIDLAFRGFKSLYQDSFDNAPVYWPDIAMEIPSSAREENYGWLSHFPQLREWLDGNRVVKQLSAHGFKIVNRRFESTVGISRTDFSDDRYGLFKPMFSEMGALARQHPDTLVFELLAEGFTAECYDGQNFFDPEHPSKDKSEADVLVSNMQAGTGPAWYLLDTSRAIKPLIFQLRETYDFQAMTAANNPHVFMTDEYVYGVRARVNAGLGLWQLAFGSKAPLNDANYALARQAMMTVRGDTGRLLGVRPDTLVVSAELEAQGRKIVKAATQDGGDSNIWHDSAKLIVAPYLD